MLATIRKFFISATPYRLRQHIKHKLFEIRDMHTRLANLKRCGFNPKAAVDGGAAVGEWALDFWRVWPECPLMLIDAQPSLLPTLQHLACKVHGSKAISCAISHTLGSASFKIDGSNSQLCDSTSNGTVAVPVATIDHLVGQWNAPSPTMLKLDLQGHELQALRGANQVVTKLEVIILEVSLLRLGEGPIFREVDQFMQSLDFCLYDILPMWYRPLDNALWQADMFYVKANSNLIASRAWE